MSARRWRWRAAEALGKWGGPGRTTYSLTTWGSWVVSILKEQYSVQRSTELVMLATPRSYTWRISRVSQPLLSRARVVFAYHISRFRASDVELHVGIFLPVSEEQGELEQESIVGIAECR